MYDKPRTAFGPALRNVNLIMGASCGRVLESTREGCSAIYENPSLFIKGTGSCHVNAVVRYYAEKRRVQVNYCEH